MFQDSEGRNEKILACIALFDLCRLRQDGVVRRLGSGRLVADECSTDHWRTVGENQADMAGGGRRANRLRDLRVS